MIQPSQKLLLNYHEEELEEEIDKIPIKRAEELE